MTNSPDASSDKLSKSENTEPIKPVAGVPYERIAMNFFSVEGKLTANLVAICAEPGMGRRDVITGVLGMAGRMGAKVIRRGFTAAPSEDATCALVRISRQACRSGDMTAVGFDDIPASDEAHVERQARALRRMWNAGVSVIFSIAPEASQLLESLPECTVVSSSDLLLQSSATSSPDFLRVTRGIPSLVRAMRTPVHADNGATEMPVVATPAYYDAVGDLYALSLRSTLADEERRVRLAMFLLGRGSFSDLERVFETPLLEIMAGIRVHAPVFGVSGDLEAFDCLSASSQQSLLAGVKRVESTCALFPDVTSGCMKLLIERGEYVRAAAIGKVLECAGAYDAVLEHGVCFLDVGEVDFIRRVLSSPLCPSDDMSASLLAASDALYSRTDRLGTELVEGRLSDGVALMFVDARQFLQGQRPQFRSEREPSSEIERRLSLHAQACSLMVRGHFSEALRILVTSPREERQWAASSALLELDYEIARLLTGGYSGEGESCLDEAEERFQRHSLKGLLGYCSIFRVLRAMMAGGAGQPKRAEAVTSKAERSGDVLVQIVALIAGCVSDLREGSVARAHVRSSLASTLSKGVGHDYLSRVSELFGEVAGYLVGTHVPQRPLLPPHDDLDVVRSLIVDVMCAEKDETISSELPTEVPWDALWVLKVMGEGMGEFSLLLAERMPVRWRQLIALGETRRVAGRADAPTWSDDKTSEAEVAPIEINLLGGLVVRVRGVRIDDWKLERRNAKSMLEYLVLRHGCGTKRFRLVEQVWPDCDYMTGFSRAYQATSSLRTLIAEIDPDLDPFTATRSSKEITLNMDLVSCDVDLFRECARGAADEADDARALELAKRAERLYVGDLYVPPIDSTGYVVAARSELRNLYADAMVAGGMAALRLGFERTAARMARNALVANNLREDAVIALVRALRACGRNVEADREADAFERRVAREARRMPPRRRRDGADEP